MRRSLALVRCHLASSGAAASRRALPVYGGLFAGAGMLFGGNGLEATTVVAGAQAPVVRALLWVAWLSVTMPTIDALWRTPASFWLRSLPVPRWWHLGVLGVLTIAAESPWWWLWSAGGGVMVGLAALGGALAGHAMVLARPPGAIGVGWVVGTVAVLVVVPVEYLAFGTWPIALVAFRRAWLAAPGRAGGRPRAVIGGPRVIALASALLVSLVRGHAAILLRSGLLFGLAAGAAWLAARSNGHVTGEARLYDACGFVAPVALAAGSAAAGPMLVTAARASWLLRTGGASARTALAAGTLAAGVVGGGLGLVTGGVRGWIWGIAGTQWPAMSGTLALAGGALAVLASLAARMAARQGTRGPGRLVGALLLLCVAAVSVQALVASWAPVAWAGAAVSTWLIGHVRAGGWDPRGGAKVLLEMLGIRKRLGSRVILEAVDLRCEAGELALVLGENGAGKSTLLRIAAGIVEPDRGAVRVGGVALEGGAQARAGLAYVPDTADAFPELSVRELIDLVAALRGVSAPPEALRERLGLTAVWHQRLATLSFGQVKRTYLLAALTGSPPLLILDEPSNGLDPEGAAMLAALLHERAAAGAGAVVATNDAGFAASLGGTRHRLAHARLTAEV